jgi:hypothetical protein
MLLDKYKMREMKDKEEERSSVDKTDTAQSSLILQQNYFTLVGLLKVNP